ncbi:MAG TPA: Maf family protein [Thermoanaerobaculia bacterium]|nr:Maf family protein [Thermoanaerobaculia bacterium]
MSRSLPRLVLASGSPRRRELLAGLGLAFTVRAADVDETPHPGEMPAACVRRLALAKATARSEAGELVLGADTVVVLDGQLLGKPRDPADACRMLAAIAGREHTVLTGVTLHGESQGRQETTVEASRVRLARMSPREIDWYVATGEPLDKAGSYAVQGVGALFVEAIYGNYTNVVGLPLPATCRLFSALGYDWRWFAAGASASPPDEAAPLD